MRPRSSATSPRSANERAAMRNGSRAEVKGGSAGASVWAEDSCMCAKRLVDKTLPHPKACGAGAARCRTIARDRPQDRSRSPALTSRAGAPSVRDFTEERRQQDARLHARGRPRRRAGGRAGRAPFRVRGGVRPAARAGGLYARRHPRGPAARGRADGRLGDAGEGARAGAVRAGERADGPRRRAGPRRSPRRGTLMRRTTLAAALAALAAFATGLEPRAGDVYGPEPSAVPSPVETHALELSRARLARRGGGPRTSPALVVAARELAALAASGESDPIAPRRVRGALARALGYDAAPAAVLVAAAPEEAARAVARALPRDRASHVGAGAVERDGRTWIVLLLTERKVKLDPFPREVAPRAHAVLAGTLSAPLGRPRVFITGPSGEASEAPNAGGAGGRGFRVPVEFPSAGRYVVEIVAEGAGGPEVAAILTVSAGGAPLDPPRAPARRPDPEDRTAAERAVVDALNATRRRHGLAPVTSVPEIAEVSRRHSEAMAAAGRVAHLVAGSGEVGERLRRAGVPYHRAFENVARAATALEGHAEAEESPAHLANVLRREPTRVGVGIARARLASGDPTVYLTETFVEPPDDGAESRLTPDARIREALWRERARAGLRPLTSDPALDALARDAAEAMRARDETDADGLGDRALALRRSIAAVDVFVASAPDEAVRSSNLRDHRFARVGVGVASGGSRRFGKGRLWIAVVYTD